MINTVDTGVSLLGDTGLSADATGATYQWLDCDDGYSVVSGATSKDFTPANSGNYAVQITQNGCVDTSACYNITISAIGLIHPLDEISIFPNPTNGLVKIDLENVEQPIVQVFNIKGELVYQNLKIITSHVEFMLPDATGLYLIKIISKGVEKTTTVVKQ